MITVFCCAGGSTAFAAEKVTSRQAPYTTGGFPLAIKAKNNKDYYVTIVGQTSPGHYSYLRPDNSLAPVTEQRSGTMSFRLSDTSKDGIRLPAHLEGGRIFVSDKALIMPPAQEDGRPSDTGYVQPDLNNPNDPNLNIRYDFFEFTFRDGHIAFGGNTTQVDGFSIPMTAELKQESSGYDKTVGIKDTISTNQVIAEYKKDVTGPFLSLVNAAGTHITAPRSAAAFKPGGEAQNYFDTTVKQAWENWRGANSFKMTDGDTVYVGSTKGDGTPLTFTKKDKDGQTVDTGTVNMPSSGDVAACAGSLASGSDTDKFVEAHLCAAFNRGVALNSPDTWSDASTYYQPGTVFNQYAAFFHKISLDGLAYGFAYDDVHDKSSVMILPNSEAPTSLTLAVGD